MQRARRSWPVATIPAGRDRWLLSYADFITLLLALFVLLYASAKLDSDRSQALFDGLEAAFFFEERSPSAVPVEAEPQTVESATPLLVVEANPQAQLREQLEQTLDIQRRRNEALGTSLYDSERGLVLSLASTEFFSKGGVEIPEGRKAVLAALAPLLAASGAPLQIEGHTDDQPIVSESFPSNWELSAARAAAVARFFITEHGIDPTRFAATGYAEFRPITPNTSEAERARNRRVDIVMLRGAESSTPSVETSTDSELGQLLDGLPPLPTEADVSLKPSEPGPAPQNLPLP
jgi:chemotaxis protein MotB